MRRQHIAVACLAAVLVAAAGLAVAHQAEPDGTIRGEPDLEVFVPDPTLVPGTETELRLQVANDGSVGFGNPGYRDLVTTARDVRVEVEADDPITVETDRQSIGSVTEETPRDVPVTLTVPEGTEPGSYTLEVDLEYSYTAQYSPPHRSGVVQERTRTITKYVDVEVDDRGRFDVRVTETTAQVGDRGSLTATVENVGGEPAHDLEVALDATSPAISFADHARDAARIDRLKPGETATVEYDVVVRADASVRTYPIDATVAFTDPDGIRRTDAQRQTGLRPLAEQSVTVSLAESTLRVGETGVVVGTIRNDGPTEMDDVELLVEDPQFEPRSPRHGIGSLAVGETATVEFRGQVPREADAVPRRLAVTTSYDSPAGKQLSTTDHLAVPVDQRRDEVSVSATDPQFVAGEDGTLELAVTNERDAEITDVRLELAVAEPLESDFRSAVVPSLAPGETDHVAFDLEVDSDAPASQYPATVTINYTDPDDEPASVRPATVAVDVTEPEETVGLDVEVVVFLATAVAAAGVFLWLYRR